MSHTLKLLMASVLIFITLPLESVKGQNSLPWVIHITTVYHPQLSLFINQPKWEGKISWAGFLLDFLDWDMNWV